MQENNQFDRAKFKDVVHYIVHFVSHNHSKDHLGNTKLHKILYYSDFLKYLNDLKPLTGEEYLRQQFGPTAKHLGWAVKELENESRIKEHKVNYYGYLKSEYEVLSNPEVSRLNDDEKQLIEHVIEFVCERTAHEISEFSHDDVWSSVSMGECIPYYAGYAMFPAEITEEELSEIQEEAKSIFNSLEVEQGGGAVF